MARKYTRRDWVVAAVILVAVLGAGLAFKGRLSPEPSAYAACAAEIRSASTNPSAAKIPYVKTRGELTAWAHGDGLRLQNQYGAMIDSSASCITDAEGRVIGLTINGDQIF